MKNLPQIFKNEKFGNITAIEKDGEPWFVAKEIADILGYSEASAMTRKLDNDEKTTLPFLQGDSNYQTNKIVINESGFYNAVLGSKMPKAKAFKKWVTSEVLPSIRKHGAYITFEKAEEMLNDPDVMITLLQAFKKERADKNQFKLERDEAIRTKAQIGSKREASSMATASHKAREVNIERKKRLAIEKYLGFEKADYYLAPKDIVWLEDFFCVFSDEFFEDFEDVLKGRSVAMNIPRQRRIEGYDKQVWGYHNKVIESLEKSLLKFPDLLNEYRFEFAV